MSNAEILDMRAAIVRRLREVLPGVEVEEHPRAELDTRDVDRCLTRRHLSLRVAFAGVREDAELSSNEVDTPTAWAIYILAKDGGDFARDVTILRILPVVLRAVVSNGWDVDFTEHQPEKVRAAELSSGAAESSVPSAMVWAVSWLQIICIKPEDATDIRDFLTAINRYDLAPKDGVIEATDTINLPQG